MSSPRPAFVERVRLKNYRSIGKCDVSLGPLTFLVGPNGAGKSNFLDALRFVADSLNRTLEHAIRDRGGIDGVRRRSSGHPRNFGARLDFRSERCSGSYAFEIAAGPEGSWRVKREECFVSQAGAEFEVEDGEVKRFTSTLGPAPAAASDRLYLTNASGYAPFRACYDLLSRMGFYNLNPGALRAVQPPDPAHVLARDGANAASILARLETKPESKKTLVEFLEKISPGILDVSRKVEGRSETVEFRQRVQGAKDPWHFVAQDMSDGTLRALGVLLALFQTGNGIAMPLVGIEEPETALHPAAAGVLLDALRDASRRIQVLATSHSADLLDDKSVEGESVLAVVSEDNETLIGPLDVSGRESLRQRLYTVGEMLRMDQLRPDPDIARPKQLELFGSEARPRKTDGASCLRR